MMLRIACLLCAVCVALANGPMLKWPELKGVKGQWKISYALTSGPNKGEFVPHNCSSQLHAAPCNQPAMAKKTNDRIRVTYQLKNATAPFQAYKNGTAANVQVVMCYAPLSFKDRPWRKFKPIIAKDKSCPYVLGKQAFPTDAAAVNTATFNFNTTSDLVSASWYVKVVVMCKDGSTCQFDETNGTSNFFTTKKEDAVGTGLIAAAAICSLLGPSLFLSYYFLDARRRKMK